MQDATVNLLLERDDAAFHPLKHGYWFFIAHSDFVRENVSPLEGGYKLVLCVPHLRKHRLLRILAAGDVLDLRRYSSMIILSCGQRATGCFPFSRRIDQIARRRAFRIHSGHSSVWDFDNSDAETSGCF